MLTFDGSGIQGHIPAALIPGRKILYLFDEKAGLVSVPQCTTMETRKSLAPPEFDTGTVTRSISNVINTIKNLNY